MSWRDTIVFSTRPQSAHDYFLRQGTDADALAAELATPDQRRRYIATFYSSRFWAHPGAFDDATTAFHTEPFAVGGSRPLLSPKPSWNGCPP